MRKPPSDRTRRPRKPRSRRAQGAGLLPRDRGTGFAAEGPGFYVWDDVASEARATARELRGILRPPAG